jgi:thiamine transporter ThiT
MKKNYNLRHIILSGIFIALGVLLPLVLHFIPNVGPLLLPMHLPAMVAAFFLPPGYAVAIGFITPLLSSAITGMPLMAPLPIAIIMAFEIGFYALVISLFRKLVFKARKNFFAPLIAVLPAMIIGRIIAGLAMFVATKIFLPSGPNPVAYVWGAIITGLVGIIAQLVLIPPLYRILIRVLPGWKDTQD